MKHHRSIIWTGLAALVSAAPAMAGIFVDISPGTAAPPGTLGGYNMVSFPADPSPDGTTVFSVTPPASAAVTGNLVFTSGLEHDKVGGAWWDTWSHGYQGDVYQQYGNDALLLLPGGTTAFYLYVEPNLKAPVGFEFKLDSSATTVTLNVQGDSGASYIGFYSDDPTDPLQYVYIRQTTDNSDGFAVGEFGISAAVPEPQTWGLLAGLGLLGFAAYRRAKT